jgi:hypothetical protein
MGVRGVIPVIGLTAFAIPVIQVFNAEFWMLRNAMAVI